MVYSRKEKTGIIPCPGVSPGRVELKSLVSPSWHRTREASTNFQIVMDLAIFSLKTDFCEQSAQSPTALWAAFLPLDQPATPLSFEPESRIVIAQAPAHGHRA